MPRGFGDEHDDIVFPSMCTRSPSLVGVTPDLLYFQAESSPDVDGILRDWGIAARSASYLVLRWHASPNPLIFQCPFSSRPVRHSSLTSPLRIRRHLAPRVRCPQRPLRAAPHS